MKKIMKYMLVVFVAGGLLNSCDTTELDLRTSPNDLAADQADPNLLLNSIQFSYVQNMVEFNDRGSETTRIDYMGGRDYFNNYPGATFNGIWSRTYSSGGTGVGSGVSVGILTNLNTLESINNDSEVNYNFHVGIGKVMYAHQLLLLVDYLGKAAFSQAGNPEEFPAPTLDDGPAVYAAALGLLDEAEGLLSGDAPTLGATDFFYGGDAAKWIKAINSIRLKAYVTTNDTAGFNAVIAGNNFISATEDDFQFQFGSRELQPDTRHQDYAGDYTPSGVGPYKSNWLMETMDDKNDPRIRYYFYRQEPGTPGALDIDGNPVPPSEETLACSLVVPPQHYLDGGYTFCSADNGYWGRSHGNDEGTPPDGFVKTGVGVYPAAGRFDDNSFDVVGLGLGGGGVGIEPIILASWVDFWRADMAASDTDRATFMRAAMVKSIAKVQSFGALDGNADKSFEPTAAEVTAYIDGIVADFNAATGDDKEDIFAEQYWIDMWGGGAEAINYYRKTGYPTTLTPNWELNPGPFPRSFLIPQNEVVTNPNLTQKTTLTEQVFWDSNPASPAFPPAN
ncbi:SusD/RagB family nutrient-binding outer membrane lipoprotein [Maribacter halichondriae]|uniref:SusD/RagB family nutrient-binding outer membrane lipoprotein n=1 Tax=Maribacter halichondriae TaxID=2980554 RepID=UPI00235A24F3|nr:SusD/RagB family nutrient-binding outer membrane lipoprotein [Maribacter sp. Hal144]